MDIITSDTDSNHLFSTSNNIETETNEHILFGALMSNCQSTDDFSYNSPLPGASVYTYDADLFIGE